MKTKNVSLRSFSYGLPKEIIALMMSIIASDLNSFEEMIIKARKITQSTNFATKGDNIILTASIPFGASGETNSIHILEV